MWSLGQFLCDIYYGLFIFTYNIVIAFPIKPSIRFSNCDGPSYFLLVLILTVNKVQLNNPAMNKLILRRVEWL